MVWTAMENPVGYTAPMTVCMIRPGTTMNGTVTLHRKSKPPDSSIAEAKSSPACSIVTIDSDHGLCATSSAYVLFWSSPTVFPVAEFPVLAGTLAEQIVEPV